MAEAGTYTLLVALEEPASIEFGGAGVRLLDAGRYAYTGSALGPGGFARVERHYRLATGEHDVRHWHVDYLLGHPASRLVDDVRSPGLDAECAVARAIVEVAGVEPVSGVGATDCDCEGHLASVSPGADPVETVNRAHGRGRTA